MQEIQGLISERAIELLNLNASDGPGLILDIGSGTGMSGSVINKLGHGFIGLDISEHMLKIATEDIEEDNANGDVLLADMGEGLSFRQGVFDGAISISAVQWLCYASKSSYNPVKRLRLFFHQLYRSLKYGARAVIQLYPENTAQMELITQSALTAGFTGGLVVDYPNSAKAKKYYLCLCAGKNRKPPKAKMEVESSAQSLSGRTQVTVYENQENGYRRKRKGRTGKVSQKQWIKNKKDRQRRQGKSVRHDSKYSGRKRSKKF